MVRNYKTIFIALIAIASGILIEKSLSTQRDATNINHAIVNANSGDSAKTTAQFQQQIHLLQAENNLLRDKLSTLANNPSTPKNIQNKNIKVETDNRAANEDMLNRLQTLEMEKQQRKANDIIDWIADSQKSNKHFNLNEALSNHFEQESRDPVWAEQQENHYRQLFNNSEELRDIALRNTQCRTSQCEITVGIINSEQSNQLHQKISAALAHGEKPISIMVATDEQQGVAKLYISDSENSFEFN
jgi:hypothetical protein